MVDVYYFTYTGCSKRIAEWIAAMLGCEPKEVVAPRLPYFVWLFMSFFPFVGVSANFPEPESDTVIFCFPKWTLNCPPATYFISRIRVRKLLLVVCYGGFDENRYARFYSTFARRRADEVKVLLVKRRSVLERENETKKLVERWIEEVI